MRRIDADLPEFVREALDDDPAREAAPLLRIPELFEAAPHPGGVTRLLSAVAEPPARYAPFYARLGALWDLPEDEVERTLSRAGDPSAFRKAALPGVRVLDVTGGKRTAGASAALVRFAPGLRFPRHRHRGYEAVLVLEGSYTDTTGQRVAAGDLQQMSQGSEHGFVVARDEPCIAATVQAGLEFTGPVMRVLQKLFG